MTILNIFTACWVGMITVLLMYLLIQNVNLKNTVDEYKRVRERLYEELANPDNIEEEMERGARKREMLDAQRHALPREDAWPPAKVHRPKMRGAKPGNWRLQKRP